MKLKHYIKDNTFLITLNLLILLFIYIFLKVLNFNAHASYIIIFLLFTTFFINIFYNYFRKKTYYDKLIKINNNLDKKYLLIEMIDKPNFNEGRIFYNIIKNISKSMNDEIYKYKKDNIDYKEYIEMWVHEVKTPLSAAKLTVKNIDNEDYNGIYQSLDSIDKYVEQVLYYAKSSQANEDYIIKSNNLENIVNEAVKKNSSYLIESNIKIIKENLNLNIYTDKKWILFIIDQIINNSIKYMDKEDKTLNFIGFEKKDSIGLTIKDNGIGISPKDINNVFKKGYTGKTGRTNIKSTGIGLYLCKKLCDKLGIYINIKSEENIFTEVTLLFPKSSISN